MNSLALQTQTSSIPQQSSEKQRDGLLQSADPFPYLHSDTLCAWLAAMVIYTCKLDPAPFRKGRIWYSLRMYIHRPNEGVGFVTMNNGKTWRNYCYVNYWPRMLAVGKATWAWWLCLEAPCTVDHKCLIIWFSPQQLFWKIFLLMRSVVWMLGQCCGCEDNKPTPTLPNAAHFTW